MPYWGRKAALAGSPSFSFREATDLVRRVYLRIDPALADDFDRALHSGQIDAVVRPGKDGAAACFASRLGLPVFMLMNFTGTLNEVMVLAHECAHLLAMHLAAVNCNGLTYASEHPTPLVETSGLLFEPLVIDELLAQPDLSDQDRLPLLMMQLEYVVEAVFRQAAAVWLEDDLYDALPDDGRLSGRDVDSAFSRRMKQYLGPAVSMPPGAEKWWVAWPHLRWGYQVSAYPFGTLLGMNLREELTNNARFIEQIRRFMGAGLAMSPEALLATMGLNLSAPGFWQQGLRRWESQIDQAERLAS
jgi:oligoendopeptidase F